MNNFDSIVMGAIATQGYDERYGDSPLNAIFNRLITLPLSRQLLSGSLSEGHFLLSLDQDKFIVSTRTEAT